MSIHQEVTINASPAAVYGVLTSSDEFAKMTGGRSAGVWRSGDFVVVPPDAVEGAIE